MGLAPTIPTVRPLLLQRPSLEAGVLPAGDPGTGRIDLDEACSLGNNGVTWWPEACVESGR